MAWDTDIEYLSVCPDTVIDRTGERIGYIEALRISHRKLYKMYSGDRWHSEYWWEAKCHRCGREHTEDEPYLIPSKYFYESCDTISCGCHNSDKGREMMNSPKMRKFNEDRKGKGYIPKAEQNGIKRGTATYRKWAGWTEEEIINTPTIKERKRDPETGRFIRTRKEG